jgi:prepilin-type N-terminal cleavage/methylation domain-containing protein/prepilin-type processing-associated H-X9-DG protein
LTRYSLDDITNAVVEAGVRSLGEPACRAFTLIELLIVVVIIALLFAAATPALEAAREAARTTQCAANLRQWAIAVGVYAHENAGFVPRRGQGMNVTMMIDRPDDWFNALPSLLGRETYRDLAARGAMPRPGTADVWMCPRAVETDAPNYFAYAMNMWLSTPQGVRPDRIDAVGPTALQVFLTEGAGPFCSVLPRASAWTPVARHAERVNIAFLDGHVACYRGTYVGCGIDDPLRTDVQWIVPNSPWRGP